MANCCEVGKAAPGMYYALCTMYSIYVLYLCPKLGLTCLGLSVLSCSGSLGMVVVQLLMNDLVQLIRLILSGSLRMALSSSLD
jgi:hypothetical protein